MRVLIAFLLLCSMAYSGDRFIVTAAPKFVANTCLPKQAALIDYRCVRLNGVDHDLDSILKEYRRAWTWPGMTQDSLKLHLRDHGVSGYDSLTYDEQKKLHAVLHEREEAAKPKAQAAMPAAAPCPGGVCPNPGYVLPQRRWRLFR